MTRRTRGTKNEWVPLPENLEAPSPKEAQRISLWVAAQALAREQKQIEAARIRQDPRRQVKWLLEFETVKIASRDRWARMKLCQQARDRFAPGGLPRPQDLEGVQRELKDGLDTLRRDAPWEIELGAKPKVVLWPPRRGRRSPEEGGAQLVWMPARRFTDRFIVAAMQALDAVGSMLRLCQTPNCPKLFLATTRQARCRKHAEEAQKALLATFTQKRREDRRRARDEAKARRRARFGRAAR